MEVRPDFLSTRSEKILAHSKALRDFACEARFTPISVQLAPTEACESSCRFCSFRNRDPRSSVNFSDIQTALSAFARLGATGLELTGGGNPLLYRCKQTGKRINDIIALGRELYQGIGLITNAIDLRGITQPEANSLSWVRVSTIAFFEGRKITDLHLGFIDPSRVGFSFVLPADRRISNRDGNQGTTFSAIARIIEDILMRFPDLKYIRVVPDFSAVLKGRDLCEQVCELRKLIQHRANVFVDGFSKDDFEKPAKSGCFIGGFKPFVASSPAYDNKGFVYICCCYSHFSQRRYDWRYVLCSVDNIERQWGAMQSRMGQKKAPYTLQGQEDVEWQKSCPLCLHASANKALYLTYRLGDSYIEQNKKTVAADDLWTI